ncbi:MAG TPA: nuclease domain-containing protein, partial [Chloroflexaceae bacterium]|nr:nuclease domain-containing protein [Chloroflexaceae bacterium]
VAPPPELDSSPPTPGEELHTLFGAELARLAAAVERLARRPPDRLAAAVAQVEPGRLRDFAASAPPRPGVQAPPPDPAAPEGRGEGHDASDGGPASLVAALAPLPERSAAPTYDSYEARLLRRLLDSLWRRLELMVARERLTPELAARAEAARERLRALRGLPFLAGVPPLAAFAGPTARMQRDPDYRAVYRAWRLLRRRPLVTWDAATLSLPVGDLPRLYERWCAAAVALALLELPGCALVAQRVVTGEGEERLVALPEGEPLVELEGQGGARLRLRYQPRYRPLGKAGLPASSLLPHPSSFPLGSLDRHTRVPDLAIELARPGEAPALLVLDAKYRLDAAGGVPEDALADAYSYLGAIGTAGGARATLAVALLYPGQGPAETYASGVAALPLLPAAAAALRAWLAGLLAPAPTSPR